MPEIDKADRTSSAAEQAEKRTDLHPENGANRSVSFPG